VDAVAALSGVVVAADRVGVAVGDDDDAALVWVESVAA